MRYTRKTTDVQIHPGAGRTRTGIHIFFTLLCLGLALIWPGVLFLVLGDDELNLNSVKIAAILIAMLFISVWLLTKIPALTGRFSGRLIVFGVFIFFLAALGAGIVSPQIRAMQENAFAPTFTPYLENLKNYLRANIAFQAPGKPYEAGKKTA